MNPLLQGHSGTTPETSRNVFSINQGTNEDDSQSDPHPEAGLLTSGREDRHDMAMGVQREREREREHMVRTGELFDLSYVLCKLFPWHCAFCHHSSKGIFAVHNSVRSIHFLA